MAGSLSESGRQALRRFLNGDLDAAPDIDDLGDVLFRAFVHAVRRRFGPACVSADVVTYVAELRGRLTGTDTTIAPRNGETLIRRALGDAIPHDIGDEERAQVQLLVLFDLVGGGVVGVDELLLAAQGVDGVTVAWW